ncbi:DUF2975 domain-containing protein [Sphingomonas sp. IBVSS2]|uniref:DUF2975 domain-containing protein n=1 Tax=Sphingomonas sp. IBVSS2 TaxID=1985172 RepID=UPI0015C509FE|nr:DUF2975 domain-containing protein [Sphingomonas sp. IBVSS2]
MQGRLRSRARLLRNLVTLVFAALVFVLVIEVIAGASGRYSLHMLIARLPMLFYLAAIWMVRQALAALARGVLFDRVMPRLILLVGIALAAGALVNVFVVPWIWFAVLGRGSYAYYDVAAITLGVVGFALVLVARLLAQAAEMREELDAMF